MRNKRNASVVFPASNFGKTREEHLQHVALLLTKPSTYVYIDTNVLAYLFRLHSSARRELLGWLTELVAQKRLSIPAWVLNEYTAKFKAQKLIEYTPRGGPQGELARLENLFKDARGWALKSVADV